MQVCGKEVLEKTTLESLGLNSGRAVLRLIYLDPEQLKTQAHISTPLLPKQVATVDDSSDKSLQKVPLPIPHCSKAIDDTTSTKGVSSTENRENSRDEAKMDTENDEAKIDIESEAKMDIDDEKVDARNEKSRDKDCQEVDTFVIEKSHSVAPDQTDRDIERDQSTAEACRTVQKDTYKIEFVRFNCANTCNISYERCVGLLMYVSHVADRREKCSSVQSS